MTSPQANYNLAALAEAAFHRLGDHESLVFEGRTYRSGELFDRACRASSGLVKLGVSPGEMPSLTSPDDTRHARSNSSPDRYARPSNTRLS